MADKTDKIDEAYVMELIAGDVPLAKKKDLSPPGKPLEQKEEPIPETKVRRKQSNVDDYRQLFFNRMEINDRQVIYINRNTYEEVYNIVFGIGGRKASVSSFIECILLHHFKIYEEDIQRIYDETLKRPLKNRR
ncbi:MAG: DUF3408 domain-containing protein [Bacteroidales bacterium]|nr:DUF3408 domain-containing protein [Bacteroidales bacterium]